MKVPSFVTVQNPQLVQSGAVDGVMQIYIMLIYIVCVEYQFALGLCSKYNDCRDI